MFSFLVDLDLDLDLSNIERVPKISPAITERLRISTGSCDVERLFSMIRAVQKPNRSLVTENTLQMEMVLYFNKIWTMILIIIIN